MHIKNCGRDEKDHCVQLNGHSRMRHSVLENGLGKGHFGVLLGPDASAEGNVVYHHLQGTGLKAEGTDTAVGKNEAAKLGSGTIAGNLVLHCGSGLDPRVMEGGREEPLKCFRSKV